jgi:SAM-dependent methyltransferase
MGFGLVAMVLMPDTVSSTHDLSLSARANGRPGVEAGGGCPGGLSRSWYPFWLSTVSPAPARSGPAGDGQCAGGMAELATQSRKPTSDDRRGGAATASPPRVLSTTVVIPAYNEERNIARLVEQVLSEPWTAGIALDQVVIVNDASEDHTRTIAEDLARRHSRVRVITHSERGGKNASMRTGQAACRSDVVFFVDADVLLGKEGLTRTVRVLADDPTLSAASCVVTPLPPRSWREWAPQWQAQFHASLSRSGHGSLTRVYAIRTQAIATMSLPDETADDLYTLRWLRNHRHRFAVRRDAEAYVRTSAGLRDFAKQTLRIWLSGQSLETLLPRAPGTAAFAPRRRATLLRAALSATRRAPLGFVLYLAWRGIIRVTPARLWMPAFDHSRYDTSQSTKDLETGIPCAEENMARVDGQRAPSLLTRLRQRSGAMTFEAASDALAGVPPPDSRLGHAARLIAQRGDGLRVLDVGCWTGGLARALDGVVRCTYTGVDIEPAAQAVAIARQSMPQHDFVIVPSVERLPFDDAAFDVIALTEVIEHVPKGREGPLLAELARVLRPDGGIIFSTPYHNALTPLDPAWFFGHRHYTVDRVAALARAQGLAMTDVRFNGGFWTACDVNLLYLYKHVLRRAYSTPGWLRARARPESRLSAHRARVATNLWCRLVHEAHYTSGPGGFVP